MQTQANDFFRQLAGTVLATVLFVASVAFVSIPASLQCNPGDCQARPMPTTERHLT